MTVEHQELQYLHLLQHIINKGELRNDRTGTGTVSVFAPPQLRFDLSKFPLLTTKKMQLRPIFEELMWFVRGSTDAKLLDAKKVTIWNANGSREFLDSRGLHHYEQGDLGPVYGFQWRHFGAKYVDCHTDYTGQGVDQLRNAIKSIKFNPMDRRIIISAWNPLAIPEMALPPCHMFCQFYVSIKDGQNVLSCQLYQRSCDMGLGVPFNIASYAILTYLIAHVCGYEVGEFVHCMGDAHVYSDHIEPLKEQITRVPLAFPTLLIHKERIEQGSLSDEEYVDRLVKQVESFEFKDLELVDYQSHGRISMKMSV